MTFPDARHATWWNELREHVSKAEHELNLATSRAHELGQFELATKLRETYQLLIIDVEDFIYAQHLKSLRLTSQEKVLDCVSPQRAGKVS